MMLTKSSKAQFRLFLAFLYFFKHSMHTYVPSAIISRIHWTCDYSCKRNPYCIEIGERQTSNKLFVFPMVQKVYIACSLLMLTKLCLVNLTVHFPHFLHWLSQMISIALPQEILASNNKWRMLRKKRLVNSTKLSWV